MVHKRVCVFFYVVVFTEPPTKIKFMTPYYFFTQTRLVCSSVYKSHDRGSEQDEWTAGRKEREGGMETEKLSSWLASNTQPDLTNGAL